MSVAYVELQVGADCTLSPPVSTLSLFLILQHDLFSSFPQVETAMEQLRAKDKDIDKCVWVESAEAAGCSSGDTSVVVVSLRAVVVLVVVAAVVVVVSV